MVAVLTGVGLLTLALFACGAPRAAEPAVPVVQAPPEPPEAPVLFVGDPPSPLTSAGFEWMWQDPEVQASTQRPDYRLYSRAGPLRYLKAAKPAPAAPRID
jgi:hypothetical protein